MTHGVSGTDAGHRNRLKRTRVAGRSIPATVMPTHTKSRTVCAVPGKGVVTTSHRRRHQALYRLTAGRHLWLNDMIETGLTARIVGRVTI